MVGDGASSHKIDYVSKFGEILNLEGHQNRITGLRVRAILLNDWTLPIGEAASGRVCACSLRSRLVFRQMHSYQGSEHDQVGRSSPKYMQRFFKCKS